MAELPFMPIATDAYLADCDHLTDAEHGRYFLILMALWRAPSQRLPDDNQWLARKFRRSVEAVEAELRPLILEFCQSDGRWITQKRLTKEFAYGVKKSEKQSLRAKSRWQKEKEASRGNAPTPTPTPTLSNKKNHVETTSAPSLDLENPEQGPRGEVGEAVGRYNQAAERNGWSQVNATKISDDRQASVRKCLKAAGGLPGWRLAMDKAEASDFLSGRTGRTNGHENWNPNLDFLTKPKTFRKLMEGGYDNTSASASITRGGNNERSVSSTLRGIFKSRHRR